MRSWSINMQSQQFLSAKSSWKLTKIIKYFSSSWCFLLQTVPVDQLQVGELAYGQKNTQWTLGYEGGHQLASSHVLAFYPHSQHRPRPWLQATLKQLTKSYQPTSFNPKHCIICNLLPLLIFHFTYLTIKVKRSILPLYQLSLLVTVWLAIYSSSVITLIFISWKPDSCTREELKPIFYTIIYSQYLPITQK